MKYQIITPYEVLYIEMQEDTAAYLRQYLPSKWMFTVVPERGPIGIERIFHGYKFISNPYVPEGYIFCDGKLYQMMKDEFGEQELKKGKDKHEG